MENLFREYVREVCSHCTNTNCKDKKSIHIVNCNGVVLAKCTDYTTNCKIKIIKPYFLPYGRNKKC